MLQAVFYPSIGPSACHKGEQAESFDIENISAPENSTLIHACAVIACRGLFPFIRNLDYHIQGFSL